MDRTVIVSGGTGGLGRAVTTELLENGWRVVVPWVAEKELSGMVEHDQLTLVRADLFEADAAAACVAEADQPGAPLRAVVNLVGGFDMGGLVHETPVEDFERLVRLNLRPTYLLNQAALPRLAEAGTGSIVCVSSRAAVRPFAGAAGYTVAKAAVLALVDALAVEYGEQGVRVNAVLPSIIDTPANRAAQPDADRAAWIAPERIAAVVRFLAGEDSETVSGAHVPVYGTAV